jgi:hypothetical protein
VFWVSLKDIDARLLRSLDNLTVSNTFFSYKKGQKQLKDIISFCNELPREFRLLKLYESYDYEGWDIIAFVGKLKEIRTAKEVKLFTRVSKETRFD